MDLARRVFSRDLKIAAMRESEGGRTRREVSRQLELSPKLLERWQAEWRKRGESAFPGMGRRIVYPASRESERIAELERKIGQQQVDLDFFRRALRHVKETRRPSGAPGGARSTKSSRR